MGRPVALTATALVTPFGRGTDRFCGAVRRGEVALAPSPGTSGPGDEPVGRVPPAALPDPAADDHPPGGFGAGPGAAGQAHRRAMMAAVLRDVLAERGLDRMPADALLVLVGQVPTLHPRVPDDATTFSDDPGPETLVSPQTCTIWTSNACASALFGMDVARQAVLGGWSRFAVVAGSAILNRFSCGSMRAVRAVGSSAARPFDTARRGISIGEGAGAVVLEPAGPDSELLLTGTACRIGGAKPSASDVDEVHDCMSAALGDAGEPVPGYVQAHATGTVQGDRAELDAIDRLAVAAGRDVVAGSHKGAVGHLLHISGFLGVAAAAEVLRTGIAPPTAGLRDAEPATAVHVSAAAQPLPDPPRGVLVNAFGFGGNTASLVLRSG